MGNEETAGGRGLGGYGRALLRAWPILLVAAAVFVVLGAYVSSKRDPVYTAKTELLAGSRDAQAEAIPGLVQAANTLAGAYARIGQSATLQRDIAARTGLSTDEVAQRIVFTPVVENPILDIQATGASPQAAATLSRQAAAVLKDYVQRTSGAEDDNAGLLSDYRAATNAVSRGEDGLAQLQRRRAARKDSVTLSQLRIARGNLAAERLAREAAGVRYTNATQDSPAAAGLTVLSPASDGVSDRGAVTQQLLVVGALAGLLVGALLVVLREHVVGSRRRRAQVAATAAA